MTRTAHKTHVWQHHPHGARAGGRDGQFTKTFHDRNLMECPELHKTHVL